ncbi:MAG: diaminopimelate decarboxylase [Candidatus Omnitrophica bacterium]|nr:diaminopimelate decarboxylase [Candidatus Omnitrophota bacterium]
MSKKIIRQGDLGFHTGAMHDFYYRGKELYCEKVRVLDIVRKVGTPVYIYSHNTLIEHVEKLQKAFQSVQPLICYSVKANSNLAVLKSLIAKGTGLDIVSGGELYRAKQVGCDPRKIVYAGVGKTEPEIEEALRYGILLFNVESRPELELIHQVAQRLKKRANISLRINPGVDPRTHHHIATGKLESTFGIDLDTARQIFLKRFDYPSLNICGIHVHIGSQIVKGEPFVEAFRKIVGFIDSLEREGVRIETLNLGGGLGVIYNDEVPQTADQFAKNILSLFKGKKYRLILEPGRFIVANGGILVGRVLWVKQTKVKNFAVTDTGMGDLIRPSLYDAYHEVWPLVRKDHARKLTYDIVGPICESGDFLAKERHLAELESGDYLAFMTAGAYGFVMASNYNSRTRPAEVLVRADRFAVVRKREDFHSLVAGESVPAFVG